MLKSVDHDSMSGGTCWNCLNDDYEKWKIRDLATGST
jgi:hypothetical protein